jgi:tetratricopeptide (TPR) repeat protein
MPTSRITCALAMAAIAFTLYAQTLAFEFVYDDAVQILENPWIWDVRFFPNLLTEAVWSFKGSQASNYFRPVQMLVYFLDGVIFGREAWAFHLTNVAIHALTAGLAYLLFSQLTTKDRAFAAGLLFSAHPAHVESVAWIAGSTDVNCAPFLLAGLLAWRGAQQEPRGRRRHLLLAAAGALYFLALLAKETAVVLPLLALMLPAPSEGAPGARRRMALVAALVFTIPLVVYAVMRYRAFGGAAGLIRYPEWSSLQVLAAGLSLIPRYVAVAFFPVRLVPDRVFDPPAGLADPLSLCGATILFGGMAAAMKLRRHTPAVSFGAALLLLPITPVLDVQLLGRNAQADRYLYIPSLGACLLIAELAGALTVRLRMARPQRAAVIACSVLALAGATRTVTAARMWKDDETLARAAIALEPRTVTMRLLLSSTLERRGRLREAHEAAAAADQQDANAAAVTAALRAQREARTPQEAVVMLRRAAGSYPRHPYLLGTLSAAALRAGLYEEARATAGEALKGDPHNVEVIVNLASAHAGLGDRAGQERHARRALSINPRSAEAWLSLGEARLAQGDPHDHEVAVRRAVDLDPALPRARLGLSLIALRRGDPAEALREAERALALAPQDAATLSWVATVRERLGDVEGARRAWIQVLTLVPEHPRARANLQRLSDGSPTTEPPR